MVAAVNQDFVTYQGDTVQPVFTVVNSSGVAVDISGATQITWTARTNLDAAAAITKTKTGGQISFVTTGTDGKFQVQVNPADTAALTGFYMHYATITDGAGNVSTVAVGRMQVGLSPAWTYTPALLSTSSLYQVRLLVGDILQGDQQMNDAEINFYVTQFSNVNLAAAACCRHLALRFARLVDTVQGTLKTNYSSKSKQYFALGRDLEARGMATAIPVRANLRAVMPKLGKQLGAKIEENMASRLNSANRLKVTKKMVENPRSITTTVSLDWTGEASKKLVPTYLEKGTKAHEIVAKHASVLAFYWPKINGWFFGPKVNHPGTKPYNLVADAWASQKDAIQAALTEAVRSAGRQR
jgi:hypothetical protein